MLLDKDIFKITKIYEYSLFGCIPLLVTKQKYGVKRYLLFGFLPIMKNKYFMDSTEYYLFAFIPLMLRNKVCATKYKKVLPGVYQFSKSLPFDAKGLQVAEDWGCWSDGNETSFYLKTEKDCFAEFDISVFLAPGKEKQNVALYINGYEKQKYVFDQRNAKIIIYLPKQKKSHIIFQYDDVKSPSEYGLSQDKRKIAICFKTLTIKTEA